MKSSYKTHEEGDIQKPRSCKYCNKTKTLCSGYETNMGTKLENETICETNTQYTNTHRNLLSLIKYNPIYIEDQYNKESIRIRFYIRNLE